MPASVTMADVARVAGVHQTTVSLALRNHRSIPAATTERIRKIATKLGYRPNPMVSALIAERRRRHPSGKGSTLAFLTCFSARGGWRHSRNYVEIYDHVQTQAALRGYQVEEFWLNERGMTPARMRDILLSRGIRGIMVCPMPEQPRILDFDFSEFAALAFGLTLEAPLLDRVAIDYHAVMSLCIDRLKMRGRRRIGFATTLSIDSRVNHLSLGTFLAERHLRPRNFVSPLTPQEWDLTVFEHWIKTSRPDALITAITEDYLLLEKWLKSPALSAHPVVDLVCVDCSATLPAQPGVRQDLPAEARAAIEWITSRVERAQFGLPSSPQTILVSGSWHEV